MGRAAWRAAGIWLWGVGWRRPPGGVGSGDDAGAMPEPALLPLDHCNSGPLRPAVAGGLRYLSRVRRIADLWKPRLGEGSRREVGEGRVGTPVVLLPVRRALRCGAQ